jgi:hypothetical protein
VGYHPAHCMQYLVDNCKGTCWVWPNSTINHYFCFPFLKAWLPWGTQQHSWILACWFIFYSHEGCSKPNLTTNPITSFETMLVFVDLANDYCHTQIKNKHLFLLNKYMHSLRQLTLCLYCFGFTLVPDWSNWVWKNCWMTICSLSLLLV